MKQGTRRKFLLGIVFVLEIFVLFLIGDTAAVLPIIGGAKPALMVCVAVSIALTGVKELTAMTYGIFCGLLMDFSQGGPYGFHAMILAASCYTIAALVRKLFQKNLLSALMMTVLTILLVFSLHWLFFYVVWGYGTIGYVLLHHYVPMAIYTFVCAIPIYFLTRGLSAVGRTD